MKRFTALLLLGVVLQPASAHASNVGFITDYALFDHQHVTVDGVYHPSEFDFGPPLTMSTASGGGGVLHAPGALYFNNQGSSLSIGFQPGATLDHTVIILLNYKAGGRSAGSGSGITPFNDTTDAARRALTSLQGQLPSGQGLTAGAFQTDAAITINADGFGFFLVPDNTHATFTQVGSYTGVINPTTGYGEAQFPVSAFGVMSLMGFDFAAAYAGDNFLYNEAVPNQPYTSGPNPGAQVGSSSPTAVPDFYSMGVFIPGPATAASIGLIGFAMGTRRRR